MTKREVRRNCHALSIVSLRKSCEYQKMSLIEEIIIENLDPTKE